MPQSEHQPTDSNEAAQDFVPPADDYGWEQVSALLFCRKSLLKLVVLVFIVTRVGWFFAVEPKLADTRYYLHLARLGVDLQATPYLEFDMEYPPVAWWLMQVPRRIASEPYLDQKPTIETAQTFFQSYCRWFHIELLLADSVCLALMFVIGRRISPTAEWLLPTGYTLLTIAQPYVMYDRLDIVLTMFFLLSIECWLRSLEKSPTANRWATASYFFVGLGISFKIMPVIFVPYLLLADAFAAGSAWKLMGRVLALAIAAVGPFLIYIPSAGWGVLKLFQYHSLRGTHLESIWSSIMLVADKFGVPCRIYNAFGGWNLAGDWSDTLKTVSSVAMLAVAASFGLWALLRGRRYDRRLALDLAQLVLINVTVLSHVYSPQYLNWLMPLALLLALNILPHNWPVWSVLLMLIAAITGISSWVFPYHYVDGLTTLQPLPVALSIARSACLVGMAVLLDVAFFAEYGLIPWRGATTAHGELVKAA